MMDLLYMDLSSEFGLKMVDLGINIEWTYEGLNRYTMGYVTIVCQHMCLIIIVLLLNNKYISTTQTLRIIPVLLEMVPRKSAGFTINHNGNRDGV
jgi:hypothetical protein